MWVFGVVFLVASMAQAAHLPSIRRSRHHLFALRDADTMLEERGVVAINVASATGGKPKTTAITTTISRQISSSLMLPTSQATMITSPSTVAENRVVLAFDQDIGGDGRQNTATTPVGSPQTVVAVDSGQDAVGWVDAHNSFRKQYGAKSLVWDHELSVKASRNAKRCDQQHSYVIRQPKAVS